MRLNVPPISMAADTMQNIVFLIFGQGQRLDQRCGYLRSFGGMTNLPIGTILVAPADIVKVGTDLNHSHIGLLNPANMATQAKDSTGVFPIMTPAGGCIQFFCQRVDLIDSRLIVGVLEMTAQQGTYPFFG